MKYLTGISIILTSATLLYACKKNKVEVIPLSPYEYVTSFTENDTTIMLTFALKNFDCNKEDFELLDTFVINKVPKEYLKDNHGILFIFYKYEKDKIDENFVHKDEPKQENLFMEAEAITLVEYSWSDGKFEGKSVYKDGTYSKSETMKWNKMHELDAKIKEVNIN